MITPPKPKETSVEEIEKKHAALEKDFKGFAEELTVSMKKHNLRQKALIKYAPDGMYPYISVAPYDWDKGEYLREAVEQAFKEFAEDLKALMRKYSLRQKPVMNRMNDGGLQPDLTVYRFDWAQEDQKSDATTEVDVKPKVEDTSTKPKKANEKAINSDKKSKATKAQKAKVQEPDSRT